MEQVYPHLLSSPPESAEDSNEPHAVDAENLPPGFLGLSEEELLAAKSLGSYRQPPDQYPYERVEPIAHKPEQVDPYLPSSLSRTPDINDPLAVDVDHLPGFFDISQEESEHQVPLPVATPSGSIAPESEQVNPHVHLPSSPSGPAADAIGPLPVNAGHVGDLPPEMPCDKKCN